jgi:hypothetical protein
LREEHAKLILKLDDSQVLVQTLKNENIAVQHEFQLTRQQLAEKSTAFLQMQEKQAQYTTRIQALELQLPTNFPGSISDDNKSGIIQRLNDEKHILEQKLKEQFDIIQNLSKQKTQLLNQLTSQVDRNEQLSNENTRLLSGSKSFVMPLSSPAKPQLNSLEPKISHAVAFVPPASVTSNASSNMGLVPNGISKETGTTLNADEIVIVTNSWLSLLPFVGRYYWKSFKKSVENTV